MKRSIRHFLMITAAAIAATVLATNCNVVKELSKDSRNISEFSVRMSTGATPWPGVIDQANALITITIPEGTDPTSMVAIFKHTGTGISVGATPQVSDESINDFSNALVYTVSSQSGATRQYAVLVTETTLTAKRMTSFEIDSPPAVGTITTNPQESAGTITLNVPFNTDVSNLVAKFTHTGFAVRIGSIFQESGVTPNNFTAPVVYRVFSGEGGWCDYTVTVNAVDESAKALTYFRIIEPEIAEGTIDEANHTVSVTVPLGTNISAMKAQFTTTGASVSVGATAQTSGVTENDFSSPVVYTVTATDGTTQNYTVTISTLASSAKMLTSFSFATPAASGVINQTDHTVAVTVPYGTNLSALVANFTSSPYSTVSIGATPQESGVTANNFSTSKTYRVTAQDGSTQDYVVTVSATTPGSGKDFLSYRIGSYIGTVDANAATVAVSVPTGTARTGMVATFTLSSAAGATVSGTPQVSGTTANNFTAPVTYLITAQDGTTKSWTVTVSEDGIESTWTNPANGYAHWLVEAPNGTPFTYRLDLGAATKNVYFIYTNTSKSASATTPTAASYGAPLIAANTGTTASADRALMDRLTRNTRGRADITEYNQDIMQRMNMRRASVRNANIALPPEPPLRDVVNTTRNFMNESTSDTIPATCRKVVSANAVTLNIWVANDSWTSGGSKPKLITQAMVDTMADKFLKAGTNNDIYEWVTNVYGAHWGTQPYSNLIGATTEISILLFDIDNDESQNGGTLGFFWSKDNFKKASVAYSNERLMFYIDSVLFATNEGGSWEITDYWPSELIGTLAHEFQHMINYYQKSVLRNTNSATWLNELCSMAAEDIVANKILADGPRGVAYDNPGAGSSGNYNGRIPIFNYYSEAAQGNWYSGNDVLKSYSINYVYGSYLTRNWGGANFMKSVISSSYGDDRAITEAIAANGGSDTYSDTLRKWFVSMMLSDKTDTLAGYQFNKGSTWFSSTVNSIEYTLGAINYFNFIRYNYLGAGSGSAGPQIRTSGTLPATIPQTGSVIYQAGANVTGVNTWTITLPAEVKLSVVVK